MIKRKRKRWMYWQDSYGKGEEGEGQEDDSQVEMNGPKQQPHSNQAMEQHPTFFFMSTPHHHCNLSLGLIFSWGWPPHPHQHLTLPVYLLHWHGYQDWLQQQWKKRLLCFLTPKRTKGLNNCVAYYLYCFWASLWLSRVVEVMDTCWLSATIRDVSIDWWL